VDDSLSPRHFSDDNVSVECTYRPGCLIEMVVTVSPAACQAAQQRALKDVRKEASLPGFRHGHVPEQIVLKHFKPQLIRRTQATLMSTAFDAAVKLNGRNPFSKNSLRKATLQKSSKELGAELLFAYEAAPKVPSIRIEELQLSKVDPKPVSEETVEEQCEWWRLQMRETAPAEDRACKDGDVVIVTLSNPSGDGRKEKEVYVSSRLPNWLYTALVGMRAGESKEACASTAEGASGETVHITLSKLFDCTIPEEDEEFAKRAGWPSVEEFRNHIRERLELEAQNQAQERMRRQVRNELIRLYAFDLPQSLVEGETEARFQAYWNSPPASERNEANKDSLRKPFLDEVKRHFTCLLLLEPLFHTVKPTYTQRQLTNEFIKQSTTAFELRAIHDKLDEEETLSRLLTEIATQQCEDYCIEQRLGIRAPRPESHAKECHCHEEGEECSCQKESTECSCHENG
jgi:trigger factor